MMIYLDANATTPALPEVWEAMRPWMTEPHGNPSSAHGLGRKARQALEDSRDLMASSLGAESEELIFTSGATEANNLAMFGLVPETPCKIVLSPVEHPCVVEPAKVLERRGHTLAWLKVDQTGKVIDLSCHLDPAVRLVAIQATNHETGVHQLIDSKRVKAFSPEARFHCDAAQLVGKLPVDFRGMGVDSLSLSGHKFHGPPGIGALLLRKGTVLRPLIHGGAHQAGKRPGTEPVALAVGMALALKMAMSDWEAGIRHALTLRRRMLHFLDSQMPEGYTLNGNGILWPPSPYVFSVSFPGCRAELLLMKLDLAGVACSTGSACSSGSQLPSPVLQAMGVPDDVLRSAMRFSWTRFTTEEEIDEAAKRIVKCVRECRADQSSNANAAT